MIFRPTQGERRVSPPVYKLLLAAHIMVSGTWLGVVVAKLALGLAAVATDEPAASGALFAAMQAVNPAFPPATVGTIVTGVLLSLGTKWGLLRHYWIATKLVLAVGVIATAVRIGDQLVQRTIAAPSGPAADGGTILGIPMAPALLISLSAAHALMLGAATVISVYKPWGKTWFGRRQTARSRSGQVTAPARWQRRPHAP